MVTHTKNIIERIFKLGTVMASGRGDQGTEIRKEPFHYIYFSMVRLFNPLMSFFTRNTHYRVAPGGLGRYPHGCVGGSSLCRGHYALPTMPRDSPP